MRINYNVQGKEKKRFVKIVSQVVGEPAVYQFVPTCSYVIGPYTVTKDGVLLFRDGIDPSEVIAAVEAAGFVPVKGIAELETKEGIMKKITDAKSKIPEPDDGGELDGLTLEMPKRFYSDLALENLRKLVDGKASLLKKVFETDELPILIEEDSVRFPWFTKMDADSVKAYTHFITALSEMARNAKRVTAQDKDVENEKYAFRCFLLRLGFIGDGYKKERKILLKNLSGSSAFKSGKRGGADEVSA